MRREALHPPKQEKEAGLLLEPLTPSLLGSETAGNLGLAAGRACTVVVA